MLYDIVEAWSSRSDKASDNLRMKVADAIRLGWKPLGGVSVALNPATPETGTDGFFIYSQAMVREIGDGPVTMQRRSDGPELE